MTLFEELKWRGIIKDISSPELEEKLNNGGMTFYIGTDPTADSMHIGHFSSFLIATRLAKYGHHPILLVGGGTGMIGDPRPTTERQMQTKETVMKNYESLKNSSKLLKNKPKYRESGLKSFNSNDLKINVPENVISLVGTDSSYDDMPIVPLYNNK